MLDIIVISDSTGETANAVCNSIMIQFPNLNFARKLFPNVDSVEKVDSIFGKLEAETVIVMTVVLKDVHERIVELSNQRGYKLVDLLGGPLQMLEDLTGQEALRKPGLMRDTDHEYFDKMEAIEFAMKYDDGKNPKGFLLSDIVLVGVSRTSKTPLSIFLANKGYKVSNLPLLPELDLPEEIFEVDSKRIIGLIIDKEILLSISNQRLKTLGLKGESIYANDDRIDRELDYAREVFEKLDCKVINVSGFTIESIASQIIRHIED